MRNTLIEARGKKTQMYASSEIGISQKYLSKLELGQRTPSLKIAIKIASKKALKNCSQIFFCSKTRQIVVLNKL